MYWTTRGPKHIQWFCFNLKFALSITMCLLLSVCGGEHENDRWVQGVRHTAEVVFTFLQVLWASGAPITFNIRPLAFIVPPENTPTVTIYHHHRIEKTGRSIITISHQMCLSSRIQHPELLKNTWLNTLSIETLWTWLLSTRGQCSSSRTVTATGRYSNGGSSTSSNTRSGSSYSSRSTVVQHPRHGSSSRISHCRASTVILF